MPNTDLVLNDLRQAIDHLDAALMFVLAERTHVIYKIGVIKKISDVNFSYSEEREQDLQKIFAMAADRNLDTTFLQHIYTRIYHEALTLMQHLESQSTQLPEFFLKISLDDLRGSLYNLDVSLCHLLAERFHVAQKVGQYKKKQAIEPLVEDRWQVILASKKKMAEDLGMNADFIVDLMNLIHAESLRLQLN